MSHTASKPDGDNLMSMSSIRNGVRDKVYWIPQTCEWGLKLNGPDDKKNDIRLYCQENDIRLSIPTELQGKAFNAAREKAFYDACTVWNELDTTGKKRIVPVERPLNVEMVPVLQSKAMSHTEARSPCSDSEDDTEAPAGLSKEEEEDMFGPGGEDDEDDVNGIRKM